MDTSRLLVMVPALNEEATIRSVVDAARDALGCDVLVVDDGSTDGTAAEAERAGAIVVSLPFNLGVGGALRTALRFAARNGYGRVVQLDGDGQHDAREALRLLDELDRGGHDIVVGSRFAAGYDVGRSRRVTMRFLARLVSRRLAVNVTDTTSGFRAMGPRAIRLFSEHYPVDYLSDTVEALLMAGDSGLSVAEINVQMHQRQGGQPSAAGAKSLYHLARLMLALGLQDHARGRAVPAGA